MDETKARELARRIQDGVPLVADPFEALAAEVGTAPGDVLGQLRSWSAAGLLREVSAVLEGDPLGYEGALVAARAGGRDVDRVARVVAEHPTVTHCYGRRHEYDLWFTISVPRQMGLDRTLGILSDRAGTRFWALRRHTVFKIGVNFDLDTGCNRTEARAVHLVPPFLAGETARTLLRALQTPMPLEAGPFAALGRSFGVPEEDLLAFAHRHAGGVVRRYAATFRHRALGVRGNGMAVFCVPARQLQVAGRRLAEHPEVSHCYARNPIPAFPYTLYAMLHGPDEYACRETAGRLARDIRAPDHVVLFSTREYKKCRLRYFLPELDAWWSRHRVAA